MRSSSRQFRFRVLLRHFFTCASFPRALLVFPLLFMVVWIGFSALGTDACAQGARDDKSLPKILFANSSQQGEGTRFVLDISEPVAFSIFSLSEPYRLVIDLPTVSFEMAQGKEQIERAGIENFRFGVFGQNRSRIVLDLEAPMRVVKAYSLPAVDANPARLVVELEAVSEADFAKETRRDLIRVPLGDSGAKTPALVPRLPIARGKDKKDKRPLVVLDPGHGGIDTGAVADNGLQESKLVLTFAKALKKRLEKEGFVRVVLTREKDEFISLGKRVAFAQARHADLFVSIHADTVREHYVRGATVYTLSDKASDTVAEGLASQENRSDLLSRAGYRGRG